MASLGFKSLSTKFRVATYLHEAIKSFRAARSVFHLSEQLMLFMNLTYYCFVCQKNIAHQQIRDTGLERKVVFHYAKNYIYLGTS